MDPLCLYLFDAVRILATTGINEILKLIPIITPLNRRTDTTMKIFQIWFTFF